MTGREVFEVCCRFLTEQGWTHAGDGYWTPPDRRDRYWIGDAVEEALEEAGVDLGEAA